MLRKLAAALAVLVGALVLLAGPAAAHTDLESVSPAPGSSVGPEVGVIELTFSGPVTVAGASVELVPSAGPPVTLLVQAGPTPSVLVAIVPEGTAGSFTVRWRAAAADGHPVEGTFGLGFAAPPSVAMVPGAAAAETARQVLTLSRVAGYLSLAVLVGGWCFVALVWPAGAGERRTRLLLGGALVVAGASTISGFAAQVALVHRDLGAVSSPVAWRDVLELPFGRAWAARGVLVALAIPVTRALARGGEAAARAPWWRVAATAVGIGLLRTPGFIAHATEGDGGALGSVADLVHLAGIAAWLGGLVVLSAVVLPRRQASELAVVVPRFSTVAMVSVAAIVVGGAVMSWQLLGGVSSLWSTEFGRTLAAKLAIFGVALVAARGSKRWVAANVAGAATAVRPLVLTVATEALLAATAVGVASVLVGTSPPT